MGAIRKEILSVDPSDVERLRELYPYGKTEQDRRNLHFIERNALKKVLFRNTVDALEREAFLERLPSLLTRYAL